MQKHIAEYLEPARLLAALALIFAAAPVPAQDAGPRPGPFARMVLIQPQAGQEAAFADGYRRHLEWHRKAGDPWSWYGWTFVLGERLGLFMDGTFGHAAADFDTAVDPAGDRRDNEMNVVPHAKFLSHGIYERLVALSAGEPLPDTAAFLALTTYGVVPGREQAFEAALRRVRDGLRDEARYSWFRLHMGGQLPQYVLMRPVATFGAAATLPDFLESQETLAGTVAWVRNELLRYQSTLSYHP